MQHNWEYLQGDRGGVSLCFVIDLCRDKNINNNKNAN